MEANVGIVLVSHSEQVVQGIAEVIQQVVTNIPLAIAGGTDDGKIGTSVLKIKAAIEEAKQEKGVLVFYDLGSARMNAELVKDLLGDDKIVIAEAPILEGSYIAAVESSIGHSLDEIVASLSSHFVTAK